MSWRSLFIEEKRTQTQTIDNAADRASTHHARMWLFKAVSLIFVFGGLLVGVFAIADGTQGGAGFPIMEALLGAVVFLLADIADSVYH